MASLGNTNYTKNASKTIGSFFRTAEFILCLFLG